MALSPQSTTTAQLSSSVKTALIAKTSLNTAYVRLWQGENFPRVSLEPKLLLLHWSRAVPAIEYPGANRLGRLVYRNLTVRCCVSFSADQAGSHNLIMEDESYGLLALEEQVLDALDGKQLFEIDESGNKALLSIEPLQLLTDGQDPTSFKSAPDWMVTNYTFRVMYVPPYTLGTPDPSIDPQDAQGN